MTNQSDLKTLLAFEAGQGDACMTDAERAVLSAAKEWREVDAEYLAAGERLKRCKPQETYRFYSTWEQAQKKHKAALIALRQAVDALES